MTELIVIYDPVVQVGVIIDADARRAFGPAEVGEYAREALQAFVDQVGQYIGDVVPTTAANTYDSWRRNIAAAIEQSEATAAETAQEAVSGPPGPGGGAPLAEATAAASGPEPPAEQPSDVDPGASADYWRGPLDADLVETEAVSAPVAVEHEQTCPNCNGDGVISYGTEQPATQCGMCNGTGKILVSS